MNLRPLLLEVLGVVLGNAGVEDVEDDLGRLVEPLPGLVHVDAEGLVLHAGQPAPEAEQEPALAEDVEHRHLLGHAGGVGPPRQDDRARAELHALGLGRQPGDPLHVVGHHRVVRIEVMLGGENEVHADLLGLNGQLRLLDEHLRVGHAVMHVLEDELQTDFH